MSASSLKQTASSGKRPLRNATRAALDYVSNASRIQLQDLRDIPGARTMGRQVTAACNQAGHTIGELQHAAKPPLGWVWGDFYRPWQRMFPGDRYLNGDINLRREYVPLSLIELQRMIDLNWFDTTKPIDITTLCCTKMIKVNPNWRQFGVDLTDEGDDIFAAKVNLEVQWASLHAIAAVERAGGTVRTAYYDLDSLRAAVNPEGWFRAGRPIPRRKYPPHSLMEYYTDPNHRGYLSDAKAMQESRIRLAEIIGYSLENSDNSNQELEFKRPEQVFLGLEPGQLVSLADKKVFEPTHPALERFYRTGEDLADVAR